MESNEQKDYVLTDAEHTALQMLNQNIVANKAMVINASVAADRSQIVVREAISALHDAEIRFGSARHELRGYRAGYE